MVGTMRGNVKKCFGSKRVPSFHLLLQKISLFALNQIGNLRDSLELGIQVSNRYYSMFPECVLRKNPNFFSRHPAFHQLQCYAIVSFLARMKKVESSVHYFIYGFLYPIYNHNRMQLCTCSLVVKDDCGEDCWSYF